jgi:hypothetical protein
MFFGALHIISLLSFAVIVIAASRRIWRGRNTPANAWMLPFAYFSLIAWLLWALQYVILIAGPFGLLQRDLARTTGLSLAVVQNIFWIAAVLSLKSKQFARVSLIVPVLIMISIVVGLLVYLTPILTFGPVAQIEGITTAAIFFVLAASIRQLRLSMMYVVAFALHGYLQSLSRYLWFPPYAGIQLLLLAFPIWHVALLYSWSKLISEMLDRFRVMISSTIEDLREERKAAERAIHSLSLKGLRSETIGSRPYTPLRLCKLWAEQCNVFILITGEKYGHFKSRDQSVVEFEFEMAKQREPGKIFVYLKEGITREPALEKFVDRLKDFERGYVKTSFNTPEELEQQIRENISGWLNEAWNPDLNPDQ